MIRFSPTVSQLMRYKSAIMFKGHGVQDTLIWFLTSMYSHMNSKISSMCEILFTMEAWIWFLSSVCPHVFFKITFLKKTFVTLTASICFLTSMCLHMKYKLTIN